MASNTSLDTATSLALTVSPQTLQDTVSGGSDRYYSFNLANRSSLALSLTGLSANADVQLLSGTGSTLQTAANPGTFVDTINQTLESGTYYLRVYGAAPANYSLNIAGQAAQHTDLIWRHTATDTTARWFTKGTRFDSGAVTNGAPSVGPNSPWKVVGTADFNGDGQADLLWRNQASDQTSIWYFNGTTYTGGEAVKNPLVVGANSAWKIVGVTDFNGDGQTDVLWRNQATDQTAVWYFNGSTVTSGELLKNMPGLGTNSTWNIVGVADLNNDGKADLIWRNQASDETAFWYLNGATFSSGQLLLNAPKLGSNSTWQLTGAADFTGDGKPQLFWQNSADGLVGTWTLQGNQYTGASLLANALTVGKNSGWQVVGLAARQAPLSVAGQSAAQALQLGSFSGSAGIQDGLGAGQSVFYKFNLEGPTTLVPTALLSSGRVQVDLFDSGLTRLQPQGLVAGTYYAKVTALGGDARYSLNLTALTPALLNGAKTLTQMDYTFTIPALNKTGSQRKIVDDIANRLEHEAALTIDNFLATYQPLLGGVPVTITGITGGGVVKNKGRNLDTFQVSYDQVQDMLVINGYHLTPAGKLDTLLPLLVETGLFEGTATISYNASLFGLTVPGQTSVTISALATPMAQPLLFAV
jgi:FG-GAP-like repeat/Bacterial pre-peptidase C-terminal domain/FG-GAP repeat